MNSQRTRSIKRLAWTLGLALVALFAYGIYDAGRDEKAPPPANSQIVFKDGHVDGQKLRFKSWSADYDKMVTNADQTILDVENVRNGIVLKNGKPYLRIRAKHMTVNTLSKDFSATGSLHVETAGAMPARTFDTASAVWSDAAQRLTLAHRVVIHSGADEPLTLGSLTFDVKTGNVEMRDVTGPLRLK